MQQTEIKNLLDRLHRNEPECRLYDSRETETRNRIVENETEEKVK